jgi:hypothetical protein
MASYVPTVSVAWAARAVASSNARPVDETPSQCARLHFVERAIQVGHWIRLGRARDCRGLSATGHRYGQIRNRAHGTQTHLQVPLLSKSAGVRVVPYCSVTHGNI